MLGSQNKGGGQGDGTGSFSVFGVLLKRWDRRKDKRPDALLEEAAVVTEVVAVIDAAELIEAASATATLTAHFQDKRAFKNRLVRLISRHTLATGPAKPITTLK